MIFWFTGQPGAGKTTLALELQRELQRRGHPVVFLDGDSFRLITLNQDYSADGRLRNIRAAQLIASKIHDDGVWAVAAFVSPFRALREEFKRRGRVLEIFSRAGVRSFSRPTTSRLWKTSWIWTRPKPASKNACKKSSTPCAEPFQLFNTVWPDYFHRIMADKIPYLDLPAQIRIFCKSGLLNGLL